MIVDSHCHAWDVWPYQPPVPDPDSRGIAEQLLFEMEQNGVDQALIVCAQISKNPDNNAYVAEVCRRHPNRLHQIVDLDSMWAASYHSPGAAERLQTMVTRWSPAGFTHYLRFEDDGSWLLSDDGLEMLEVAAREGLLASIHCHPHQQPAIRSVAERFPGLPILIHHLGHPKVGEAAGLEQILESARYPNIYIKISGFYYATAGSHWDFPITDAHAIVRAIYDGFGPKRLCWGSDYPVVSQFMTYRQSLEALRSHCDFVPSGDWDWILGRTLAQLLRREPKLKSI